MDEAKDYKAYLKALKKATDSVRNDKEEKSFLKRRKILSGGNIKTINLSCGGMGIAVRGGKFEGVK